MADPKKKPADDPHCSFEDSGVGIGENADGTFNVFPLSELAARCAERAREEAAIEHAIEQSEQGFPEEDFSDLEGDEADVDEGE